MLGRPCAVLAGPPRSSIAMDTLARCVICDERIEVDGKLVQASPGCQSYKLTNAKNIRARKLRLSQR